LRTVRTPPLVIGLCLLLLAACTPRQPYPLPERPDIPFGQGRLWKVDGAGIETSYLFGTMHVDDKRVMDLPPEVEAAFAEAEIAAFEITANSAADAGFEDVKRYRLPGDETLEDLIGARSVGILRWHMRRSDLLPRTNIKPWVFWEYLGGRNYGFVDYDHLEPSGEGKVLDDWLESRARIAGKEVVALESRQEQFDIYDKIPLDQQADMLKLTLEQYAETKPWVPKLQLYLDGDLAMFDALWRQYLSQLQPGTAQTLEQRLIIDRNYVMVERMLPLMRSRPTFVAVGAAHMAGEHGVLHLLESRGYRVTRLR